MNFRAGQYPTTAAVQGNTLQYQHGSAVRSHAGVLPRMSVSSPRQSTEPHVPHGDERIHEYVFIFRFEQPRQWSSRLPVLTTQPAAFTIAYPVGFNILAYPGHTVNVPTLPPSTTVIGTLLWRHTEDLRIFNKFYNVDKACKKNLFFPSFLRQITAPSEIDTQGT